MPVCINMCQSNNIFSPLQLPVEDYDLSDFDMDDDSAGRDEL